VGLVNTFANTLGKVSFSYNVFLDFVNRFFFFYFYTPTQKHQRRHSKYPKETTGIIKNGLCFQ
ncbi:TPA: hypothetical protein DEP21_01885, partial [Patescibacteria group bacterium]|nr:hypothetical protein [Candidatus Gracilibacteria bacterium]